MRTGADADADQGQMLQSSTHGYMVAWPALPGLRWAEGACCAHITPLGGKTVLKSYISR